MLGLTSHLLPPQPSMQVQTWLPLHEPWPLQELALHGFTVHLDPLQPLRHVHKPLPLHCPCAPQGLGQQAFTGEAVVITGLFVGLNIGLVTGEAVVGPVPTLHLAPDQPLSHVHTLLPVHLP